MSKAIFKNHEQAVAQFLHQANLKINIAVCWFSNPLLFSILLKKAKSGCAIQLIVQYDQANFHSKGLSFYQLVQAGGKVNVFHQKKLLHHKFAIADDKQLLTGSYNWTRTQHADNLLLLETPHIVKDYADEFEQLWHQTEPLSLNANAQPPPPGFHQLFQPVVWKIHDLRYAIVKGAKVWLSIFSENEMPVWKDCLRMQRHFLRCSIDFFEKNQSVWNAPKFQDWADDLSTTKRRLLKRYAIKMKRDDVIIAANHQGKLLAVGLVGSAPQPTGLEKYGLGRYVQWFEFSEKVCCLEKIPREIFSQFRGSGLQVVSWL